VVSWGVPGFSEERELGSGGSGRVVAAVRAGTGERVAIKYLSSRLSGDPQFVAAFRAEAALLKSLDAPYVVRLLEYVEVPGQGAAIVMELVEGVSLHEMITGQGPGSPEAALAVLKGSLLGLAAAHALGIVHRDYKPENVLVDASGQSKLADFGVATRSGQDATAGGTPLYMAPEQWNHGPATPATDIYAATAVFFECLTGTTPFSGPLGQLAAQHRAAAVPAGLVDEPLRGLITRGMAKDPAARPGDAAQFLAELEATAEAAYGAGWEARGRSHLAERAAALLLLLLQHGSAATAGGTTTATASTRLPGSSQGTQGSQPAHAGQATGSSGQAGEAHAEHLHHIEHLEHVEHEEHLAHLRAEDSGNGGNDGQPARRASRPRPRLHPAVAVAAVVLVVAAVAGVAVALSSHNGSGSSGAAAATAPAFSVSPPAASSSSVSPSAASSSSVNPSAASAGQPTVCDTAQAKAVSLPVTSASVVRTLQQFMLCTGKGGGTVTCNSPGRSDGSSGVLYQCYMSAAQPQANTIYVNLQTGAWS
jgi:hypothetical protein